MTSASKKRRRRREREKRTEELLQRARAISLVDIASPPPTTDSSTNDERRQGSKKRKPNGMLPSPKRSSQDSPVVDNNPVSSTINLSQQPSWKRVDFVLPRADGKKRFVFDRQMKLDEEKKAASSQENRATTDQHSEENAKKSETIEDILFAGKRKKESVPKTDLDVSPDQDEGSAKKGKQHDKSEHILSESQRRKLEGAFESAHQEENSLALGNFVAMPKTNEQRGNEKHSLSPARKNSKEFPSPDGKPKATLSSSDEKRPLEKKASPPSPGQISGRTVKEAVRDKRGLRPRANSTDGELNLPRGGLCDERMILEAHKWNTERKFMNQTPPRGFHNLGNTCFLNATLQCLAYLPPFCQTLVTISNNKIGNGHNGGKKKIPQGQRITASLCSLFQQAHSLNKGSSMAGGPFAPKRVVGHLSSIGSCGSRNGYKFRLGRQEDAHEFLVHLLDAMNDGELRAAGINQTVSGWRDRLPVSRLDETTFVHRIFGGYFRSQVRCRRCNYKSNTYDPFLDLSLEVSKKSSTSVLRALSEFTRKETLDAANQWKCSGCKKYVCATKQLTVFRPPLSLCIQLKRFAFDNSFGFGQKFSKYHNGYGSGGGGSKITKPIEFPGSLHLPLSDNRSCEYTLTGIVIHVGGSSQSGHYTAYVKKPGKNGANQWYHMDDSHVEPVSERTVLKQKDAYLLFYCRKEVKLEFPDPPSRSMSASEATEFGRTRAIARAKSLPSLIEQVHDQLARSQQEIGVPLSGTKQKQTLQKVKTTNHPLAGTPPSPQTAGRGVSSFGEVQNSGASLSSSSSNNEDYTEIDRTKKLRKETNVSNQANNHRNPSINDSQQNESSSTATNGSESDSSSGKDYPEIRDRTIDDASTDSSNDSAVQRESEVGNLGESPPGDEKISREKGSKAIPISTQSAKKAEDSSESDTGSEDESSSDEDTGIDDESSSDEEKKNEHENDSAEYTERNTSSAISKRTQVVQNANDSRGKVKVMLGPRKRKVWESVAKALPSKGSNFQLLGNRKVSQWDDDDDDDGNQKGSESVPIGNQISDSGVRRKRKHIIEKIDKQNQSRKRKMHLDRWDSHLDQGKQKKVKSGTNDSLHQASSTAPKKNIFQRIQSGVQRMNRAKPKGFVRRKFKNRKGRF